MELPLTFAVCGITLLYGELGVLMHVQVHHHYIAVLAYDSGLFLLLIKRMKMQLESLGYLAIME